MTTDHQTKTRVLIDGKTMEPPTSISVGMLPSTVMTYQGSLPGKHWYVIEGITPPPAGRYDVEIRHWTGAVVGGLCDYGFNEYVERDCFVPIKDWLERRTESTGADTEGRAQMKKTPVRYNQGDPDMPWGATKGPR